MELNKLDLSEILGSDSESESQENGKGHCVPSPLPKLRCHLEITLKHPYNKQWQSMNSTLQKKWYSMQWNKIKNACSIPVEAGYSFEFHDSGHVHLHGFLIYTMDKRFSAIGMVADMAKAYYMLLPKQCKYNHNYMYAKYCRYASPAIAVQFKNWTEEPERIDQWKAYIIKHTGEYINS